MKPEPLTKEIKKKWRKLIWDDEHPEFWDIFEDFLDLGILEVVRKVVKKRVNWLLKEIEKKREKIFSEQGKELDSYYSGYVIGLMYAKQKIKKAFEGVVRE